MCGIAGILGEHARDAGLVRRMIAPLRHRGPDDEGLWLDPDAAVALGHRRLAVVDLSPAGHQPMQSVNGRYVLTFNGEIYNFGEIRKAVEAAGAVPDGGWRGHSDTEILLQAIAVWGLDTALEKSVGMFAFGLWDKRDRTLTLARDRFGEKPLYYGWVGTDFMFASELKSFRAHPCFDNPIDRQALSLFVSRGYVPAPLSIYRGIFKLPPGSILEVTAEGARRSSDPPAGERDRASGVRLRRYWSYEEVVRQGLRDPIDREPEALEALEEGLSRSIALQSFADVPVGAFLSGGIDSSTIVALYQKHSSIPVRTFSIGFAEAAFNEAKHAKAVAQHLGTIHEEHYVNSEDARDVIPLLPAMYDEPFADSSQIPTFLVSRFASREVTVALTGDGGDELFGGYNRHVLAPRLWRNVQSIPQPVRAAAGLPLSSIPAEFWNGAASLVARRQPPHFGAKVRRGLGAVATASRLEDIYSGLTDEWGRSPVIGGKASSLDFGLRNAPDAVRMMHADAVTYLPDDILCKVDRASMAVSLETRVPFLDHRVAEIAARIPLSLKLREGRRKFVLRRLLERHVPTALIDRPKAGFAVPVGEWIKGPLRPWAEELLDHRSMREEGWLDADRVSARWRDHLRGACNSTQAIWTILMFQAWLRQHSRADAVAA